MAKNKKKKNNKKELERQYGNGIAPVSLNNNFKINTPTTETKKTAKKTTKKETKKKKKEKETIKVTDLVKSVDPDTNIAQKYNTEEYNQYYNSLSNEQKAKENEKVAKQISKKKHTELNKNRTQANKELAPVLAGSLDEQIKKQQQMLTNPTIENRSLENYATGSETNPYSKSYNKSKKEKAASETMKKYEIEEKENQVILADYLKNYYEQDNQEPTIAEKILSPVTQAGTLITGIAKPFGYQQYKREDGLKTYLPDKLDLNYKKTGEKIDSGLGKFIYEAGGEASKILASSAVNYVAPGAGTFMYWTSMGGNNIAEARNKATEKGEEATGKVLLNAAAKTGLEYVTGKFLGSATKGLTGGKASELEKAITDKVFDAKFLESLSDSTKLKIAKLVGSGVSEGTEEAIQDPLEKLIDILTFGDDGKHKNVKELVTDLETYKDALKAGAAGAVTSWMVEGTNMATNSDYYTMSAAEMQKNKRTKNEQKVIDAELQNRIWTEFNGEATAKEVAQLQKEIIEDMEKGYVSTDTIEQTLGGKTYKELAKINQKRAKLQQEINDLQLKANNNELSSLEEKQKLNDLKEEISKIDDSEIRNQLNQEIQETIKNDIGLQESYREVGRRTENYKKDLSTVTDEKQRAVYQKAMDSGVLNNSNKTHALVDMIAKISSEKGINFDFTNNEQLEKSGFGVNGRNINGYVTDSGITINLNSSKAINRIVGHELTHTFEGTTLYTELQDSLKDFLGSEWDNQVEKYKELYKGVKNANIENELTSDLIGDYLFTDENYVKNLSTKNKNLFEKIYDEIKYLYNVATAGSKEKRQLEKVKRTFDRIYNETESKVTSEDTKLSLNEDNDLSYQGKQFDKAHGRDITADQFMNKNIKLYDNMKESTEAIEQLNKVKGNPDADITIYRATPSNSINTGDWVFLDKKHAERLTKSMFGDIPIPGYKVVEEKVKAKDVDWTGKNLEFVYNPQNEENVKSLEQRVSGDDLLDAQDLIEEIKQVGANVDENGYVTVYHQTTNENAQGIRETGKMSGKENGIFFSTSQNASQADGRGTTKLEFKIPAEKLVLDDLFDDNADVKIISKPGEQIDVSDYLVNNKEVSNTSFSLSEDSQGKKLSEGQQEYFKDSKVRDDEGRLLEVYHGTTKGGFSVFDTSKLGKTTKAVDSELGFHFTDNKDLGRMFADEKASEKLNFDRGTNPELKSVYLNMAKPLDLNTLKYISKIENNDTFAKDLYYIMTGENISNANELSEVKQELKYNAQWNSIERLKDEMTTTPGAKDRLIELGYDGVVLGIQENDIMALNQFGINNFDGNEYIVFNSNQIKNVDNLNPTSNDDIRYSISRDSKNTKLNENQQEYFIDSKVRDKKGRLLRVYHGTPYMQWDSEQGKFEPFYKFDKEKIGSGAGNIYGKGFYFTNKQKDATGYSDVVGDGSEGHTYEVYLNITNPYYANTSEAGYINTQKLQEQGYDGVIVESSSGNTYVAFEPNQIKNIDNLNPTVNDDIRYDLSIAPISKNLLTEAEQDELDGLRAVENSGFAELTPEEQNRMMELENRANKVLDKKAEKMLRSASYKAINTSTKIAENYLDFDARQKKEFRNQMREFSNMTRDELVNADTYNKVKDIVSQYANKEYTYFDDSVESLKRELKHTKIQISDELKNQITDYGDFVRDSRLLLRRNSGEAVDKVYKEYSEMYPGFFDEDVWNEADQLEALNDFVNHDFSVTEKYRLSDNDLKAATDLIYNKLLDNSLTQQDLIETEEILDKKVQKRTRSVVREELLQKMGITPETIQAGNDISAISFARTDPIRVNEKVFGWETGQKINDATVNFTKHQEAERIRFLNKERQEIKDLGIKARSKESELVQKYGEKQYIDKNNEVHKYGDAELERDVKDEATREKIKYAARVLRQKYDTYIDRVNSVLTEMGYDEIPKRKDYMRHFVELDDKFSRWGLPFNKESMSAEDLPTDINGLTEFNRPGKSYFASANTRTGLQTTYDAITGIDGYLEGVSNLIYHTESIQRYRALTRLIRENYGREHGFDNIDLMTDEELADRIKDIQDNKLSKYVAWLDEQANSIAGKKGSLDRSVERLFGRRIYTALNTLKSQVGSNMTGFNVRSAMTNFASAIQGMSKTQKIAFTKGTISTINNIIHNDGMIDKSDFLTRRFGSDSLALKPWQKLSKAGQVFMEGTDYFTANQIWRSKYYENLQKGMSEEQAIRSADDFAARIMGDRSKGSTAELFNSKTLGFLSQFQLEVNNQWSSLIHDNKIDIQKGDKTALGVTFELGQLFAASYLFNTMMKSLTGSDVMIDPIDMMKKIFFPDDDDDEDDIVKRAQKVLGEFINQLPFANLITGGGRIPISEAFTGVQTLGKKLMGGTDNYGNEITWGDVKDDALESAAYWLLPTGYGQIRKTTKGLSMYDDKLPIAGSYTDSGNLRFSAEDTTLGKIKAGLFGQYSSKYAQDYIKSGYKSINASKLDEMKDLDMNSTEYRKYRQGLSEAGTSIQDKLDYISSLDVSDEDKTIMASNAAKKDIDMSEYKKYGTYEEFNYAQENPAKYKVMKYLGGYDTYKNYEKAINDIKADYDRNGKAITNSRKNKVISYVNSLNLTKAQKAMLIKEEYPSFTKYDNEIASYIDKQNISFIDKASVLKQLGFTTYDKQIINYIKQNYRTVEEQQRELEKLGFKVYNYNGKTYVR